MHPAVVLVSELHAGRRVVCSLLEAAAEKSRVGNKGMKGAIFRSARNKHREVVFLLNLWFELAGFQGVFHCGNRSTKILIYNNPCLHPS